MVLLAKKSSRAIRNPRLAVAILNAQIQMRGKARMPFTVSLRGRVRISGRGEVVLGTGVTFVADIVPIEFIAHEGARVLIGDGTFINYGSSISAHKSVSIGHSCHLGHYTRILDNSHHDVRRHYLLPASKPVVIEDHVWIGSHTVILPGVHIGHNAVIGAGSVVSTNIPANSLAIGNPAKVVRRLD